MKSVCVSIRDHSFSFAIVQGHEWSMITQSSSAAQKQKQAYTKRECIYQTRDITHHCFVCNFYRLQGCTNLSLSRSRSRARRHLSSSQVRMFPIRYNTPRALILQHHVVGLWEASVSLRNDDKAAGACRAHSSRMQRRDRARTWSIRDNYNSWH